LQINCLGFGSVQQNLVEENPILKRPSSSSDFDIDNEIRFSHATRAYYLKDTAKTPKSTEQIEEKVEFCK